MKFRTPHRIGGSNLIGDAKPYFLGLVAIFHTEQKYLIEWLEFHLAQGFQRFYLYNNEEDAASEYQTLLQNYTDRGIAILHNWPDKGQWTQKLAYQHALQEYGKECTWISLLDIDEFLFPNPEHTLDKTVSRVLEGYFNDTTLGQLIVPRYNFGNYWHVTPPIFPGVLENYLTRDQQHDYPKAIIKSSWLERGCLPKSVHQFDNCLRKGAKTLDGRKIPLPLRINHYMTKSSSEFSDRNMLWHRKQSEKQFSAPDSRRFKSEIVPEAFNKIYDATILDFLPEHISSS